MAESRTRYHLLVVTIVGAAGLALAGCGVDNQTTSTSDVGTETSVVPTSTNPPNAVSRWVDEQVAAGRTSATVQKADGTTRAWLVVAHAPANSSDNRDARLLLADGTLVELPNDLPAESWPSVYSFGGAIAITTSIDNSPVLWMLDIGSESWLRAPDLGLVENRAGNTEVAVLGDSLLLATGSFTTDSKGVSVPDGQHGVLVSPTLELTPMAPPPDGLYVQFTSIVGSHGLILGVDAVADERYHLEQPWEFDALANEWTPVPHPEWLVCAPTCVWRSAHEGGDASMETATEAGVVILLPDRSLGLYDPTTRQWRRLESPPFTPTTPATAVLDDGLVVAANQRANFGGQPFGSVGVLDLADGTWAVFDSMAPDAVQWEARTDGSVALLKSSGPESSFSGSPDFVFEPTTRSWRPITEADTALWLRLGGDLDITDLEILLD